MRQPSTAIVGAPAAYAARISFHNGLMSGGRLGMERPEGGAGNWIGWNTVGHAQLGHALYAAGRSEEAIASLKKAIRLNPIPPAYYLDHIGEFYRFTERYEEAIAAFQKALHRSPNDLFAHRNLTITYFLSSRHEEGRAQAKEVLRVQPKFSFEGYAKRLRLKNQADRKHLIDALRKAGLS